MTYRVVVQRLALADLNDAYTWAAQHAPDAAARWLERFHEALRTLDHNPRRCGYAGENAKVEIELREFHYGRRPNVYRAIFTVEDDAVRILRILRAQRRHLTKEQIDRASES